MGGTFLIFIILYQINETYLNGYIIDSLDFLALSSVLSSIFVIISQNPISSVLFLITLFISIAGYLILLGLNFIGISYLLVYVGAVNKCINRSLRSNIAAWVIIPLYKVLL